MIVLHPSSRCDVCLDPYTWNTPSDTPHAIPCGHIFCKTCLSTLAPSLCPLCRKTFLPDRAKRLHVDRPAENVGTDVELDFLQRLALVSGHGVPPGDVGEVMNEVHTWLENQPPDSNQPIRAACATMAKHQTLKDKYAREKAEHREAKRTLRRLEREYNHDRRMAEAVEQRLLAQLQELETDCATYVAKIKAENETLRAENARFRQPNNPLPPPPQPLPLDRFPPSFNESLSKGLSKTSSSTEYPRPGGHDAPYMNGYTRPPAHPTAVPSSSGLKPDSARSSDKESKSKATHDPNEPFRLGSKRTHIYAPPRTASSPPPPPAVPPKSHAANTTHRAPTYSRSQSDSEYRQRHGNGIVPGAAAPQRLIPQASRWPDAPATTTAPATLGTTTGPMNGWSDPIGNHWVQVGGPTTALPATVPQQAAVFDIPSQFAPAAAFVSGYGAGLGSAYAFVSQYPTTTAYDDRENPRIHSSPRPVEEGTLGGLGLVGVPPPRLPGSVSPEGHDSLLRRPPPPSGVVRHTSTGRAAAMTGTTRETPGSQGVSRRQTGHATHAAERNSRSSWGTVETREVGHEVSTRGSMSELGLIGLSGVMTGARSTVTLESLLTTPVRLGQENGFMGSDPVPHREDDEDDDEVEDEDEDEEEGSPRRAAAVAYSGQHQDGETRRQSRHSVDHHRNSRHGGTTMAAVIRAQTGSNSPSNTIREGSVGRAGLSSGEGSNALALEFNPSLSSLDLASNQSHLPQPVTRHSQITAPTPIVSRGNIMRNWELDII